MFDHDDFDDEDIFKEHNIFVDLRKNGFHMKGSTIAYVVLSCVAISILLCWCCRRRRNTKREQVLSPPVQTVVISPGRPAAAAAPYPQQTYAAAAPYQGGPYPNPTTTSPYPNAGAPYPAAGAPYPAGGAPYHAGGAPYPTMGGPEPPGFTVTPAPPPSYNEAVSHEAYGKQAPYNPSYPHS